MAPGVSELASLLRAASKGAGGVDKIRGKLLSRFPRIFSCVGGEPATS